MSETVTLVRMSRVDYPFRWRATDVVDVLRTTIAVACAVAGLWGSVAVSQLRTAPGRAGPSPSELVSTPAGPDLGPRGVGVGPPAIAPGVQVSEKATPRDSRLSTFDSRLSAERSRGSRSRPSAGG